MNPSLRIPGRPAPLPEEPLRPAGDIVTNPPLSPNQLALATRIGLGSAPMAIIELVASRAKQLA